MQCDQKIVNRLKRAEGQMRGIQSMMLEGKECSEMMIQLAAVRSSIDNIMGIMAGENLKFCLENPLTDPVEQAEKVQQALTLIQKK